MQLFKHRVPADDAEIFDAGTRWRALRNENYSEGVLLSGLPLYLDEPGRAYDWTPLASVFSRWGDQLGPSEKAGHRRRGPNSGCRKRSTLNAQRSMLNGLLLSWKLGVGRGTLGVSLFVHEMAFRFIAGTDHLRRRGLVRLQHIRQRRN